jgi:hypothetical protein
MKEIKIVDREIDYFIERLSNKEYFSYSRFNDGELLCVVKEIDNSEKISNGNCDGHLYYPDLAKELMISLTRSNCEDYFVQYLGNWIRSKTFIDYTNMIQERISMEGVYQYTEFIQLMFHKHPEKFKRFVDILNQYDIMIVGPEYLEKIKFIKFSSFVKVPTKNCYNSKDSILTEIRSKISTGTIVLFSSSMATNVFIDELYDDFGSNSFLIDVGSIWDIFFHKTNTEIKQRTPNLDKLDDFKEWYKEYF